MGGGTRIWNSQGDYRAKATRGVALAACTLMLPFTIYWLYSEVYIVALGGVYITAVLVISASLVALGKDHEPMVMYGLVPGGTICMALAFSEESLMASIWCFPSILACYCMLGRCKAMLSNTMIMVVAVPLMWLTLDPIDSARFSASLAAVSLFASILVREIDAQQRRLLYQLDHDPLTGLLNRTSLRRRIENTITQFQRHNIPASLLALDLDHFKSVNDRFGHDTGDLVLREFAALLLKHVNNNEYVFRLGGEEFLILSNASDKSGSFERAEVLREKIAKTVILQGHRVTASIGQANLRASDDRESWVRRSDKLLYAAKHAGRDQVVSDAVYDVAQSTELPLSARLGAGDFSEGCKGIETSVGIAEL